MLGSLPSQSFRSNPLLAEDSGKQAVTTKHNKATVGDCWGFNRSTCGRPGPDAGDRSNLRRLPEEADRMGKVSEEDGGRVFRIERTAHVVAYRGGKERGAQEEVK